MAYIEQCLVPALRRNDLVVMDSCRAHMGPAIRTAIEKAHATLRYCQNTRPTSIQSNCLTANSKVFLREVRREPFRASLEQFAY